MSRVTSHHVLHHARLNTVMEELLTTDLGICNTRRELFGQLFEELIRQEMIACKVSSTSPTSYSDTLTQFCDRRRVCCC